MNTNLANYAMRPVPEKERHFMNDQVFKFVFGKTARKELTIDLLNTFLAHELGSLIRDLSFQPQENSAENVADKEARLDVVCLLDNGSRVDIEVQMVDQHNMIQRALYYWAVQYCSSLPRGGAYEDLRPAVSLNILGFSLFEDKEEPFSSWGICNAKTGERLTRDLSLNFLEIPKFAALNKPRSEWTRMERWMCFFSDKLTVEKKREILQMDATIAKAIEATDQFFQDPVHRQMYWESERSRMDRLSNEKYYRQQGREEGREEGLKEGRERGLKEGREEGREEATERMVVKVLRKLSVTDVARFLDLPVDYVKTIAAKNGVMAL